MAVDSFQISLRRTLPQNNTVKQGQLSRYIFWDTGWKTVKSVCEFRQEKDIYLFLNNVHQTPANNQSHIQ